MKNLRTFVMSAAEREDFDPHWLTMTLRLRGFQFDRDTCPIKFKRPFDQTLQPDGSVIFRQWEE